jgi:CubicO group peptidase (beta-lactamase class C family)
MIDGQAYREIGVADHASNDAARMLFGIGRRDVAAFAASLPLVHVPGTHWNYNSAGVNLVTDALGRVFAPAAEPAERKARIAAVMKEELFAPLGMSSARPQFDAAGTFIGSALMYATARDWARFGLLYLRDGMWQAQRILPIVLVPSKDLIVVRLGHLDDRIGWRPLGDWLEHLVGLFPDAPQ